jgi:hypothetical protein
MDVLCGQAQRVHSLGQDSRVETILAPQPLFVVETNPPHNAIHELKRDLCLAAPVSKCGMWLNFLLGVACFANHCGFLRE